MNVLAYFGLIVFAAETIISPLPDTIPFLEIARPPTVTFGEISNQGVLGTSATSAPAPSPVPKQRSLTKSSYRITLLGDSMIDTLGPDGAGLGLLLKETYPDATFIVRNAGTGATDIAYGLHRLTNGYTYLGADYPSALSDMPDILVIESFAYNPMPIANNLSDSYWIHLSKIIDTARVVSPETKIVIAATIAPNSRVFGDGAAGLAFSSDDKRQRTDVIKSLLENTVRFADSQHLPVADAYHPSLNAQNDGKPELINAGDHIHYSPEGASFFAKILASTITGNKLLE